MMLNGGQNSEEIYSIDADETGGAYVLSRTSSRVTYSIDPDNSSRISNTNTGLTGTTDVMVSKISNEGKWQWTESVSGAGNDDAHAIASMSGGAIVLGGTASLQLAFDTHSILKSDDPLNMDLWMAGISDNGTAGGPGLNGKVAGSNVIAPFKWQDCNGGVILNDPC